MFQIVLIAILKVRFSQDQICILKKKSPITDHFATFHDQINGR